MARIENKWIDADYIVVCCDPDIRHPAYPLSTLAEAERSMSGQRKSCPHPHYIAKIERLKE